MSRLLPRESAIVISIMLAAVVVAGTVRFTYRDVIALFDRPSQEEIAAGEQAIEQLQFTAEAVDTAKLIAAVGPCSRWRGFQEACVTVNPSWRQSANRQEMATQLWKTWAAICTSRQVGDGQDDCFLRLQSPTGEVLGGSARGDASRIWVRK